MSFVMRKTEHSNVPQIKYFKVLVQEMALQADKGFINAMITLLSTDQDNSYGVRNRFHYFTRTFILKGFFGNVLQLIE